MKSYIVLGQLDLLVLASHKEVKIVIDGKEHFICTDECFEKQFKREVKE